MSRKITQHGLKGDKQTPGCHAMVDGFCVSSLTISTWKERAGVISSLRKQRRYLEGVSGR